MERLADISCFESLQNNQTVYAVQNWSLFGLFKSKKKKTTTDKIRDRLRELRTEINTLETAVNAGDTDRTSLTQGLSTTNGFVRDVLQSLNEAYALNKNIADTLSYYGNKPLFFRPKKDGDLDECLKSIVKAWDDSKLLVRKLYEITKKLRGASEYNDKAAQLQQLNSERDSLNKILGR